MTLQEEWRMKRKNVLIVDDSEPMRRIIRRVLETLGNVRIFEGSKPKEGVSILLEESIDLLITDWNMLEMDGLEFTRVLRSLAPFERLPILMLSNHDSQENRVEALLAGIDVFLSKCAPFDEWRKEVSSLLQGSPPKRRAL
jgi:two-component system chemotaxis response regulator CheY